MTAVLKGPLTLGAFYEAKTRVSACVYHTPHLTSRVLSERTSFNVRLKAGRLRRGSSHRIRDPLNRLAQFTAEQKSRGVICSSVGNHVQGVALGGKYYGIPAMVNTCGVLRRAGMKRCVQARHKVALDEMDCIIDGLRTMRVGAKTLDVVKQFVDEIVALADSDIFDAAAWVMSYCKLITTGPAALKVWALLHWLDAAPPGAKVACVLSGGNADLSKPTGLSWNQSDDA
jgi:threonine dehydratase